MGACSSKSPRSKTCTPKPAALQLSMIDNQDVAQQTYSDADILSMFVPENVQNSLHPEYFYLHRLVTDTQVNAIQFQKVLEVWIPLAHAQFSHSKSFLQVDSLLICLFRNHYRHVDFDHKVQLLLDHAPCLSTVDAKHNLPSDPVSIALHLKVPSQTIMLLLNRGGLVIKYDSLMRSTLFYFLEQDQIDAQLLELALFMAQREIDVMLQKKRIGSWKNCTHSMPSSVKYSMQHFEPEELSSFISAPDLRYYTFPILCASKKLPLQIIELVFRHIDPALVEDLWDEHCAPTPHTSFKTASIRLNALGEATQHKDNFPSVRFLASRGLTRPRPFTGKFNPCYRFIILYYSQLRLPTKPKFSSVLHSLFSHYNPLVHTVFRLAALPRPVNSLDINFYTNILSASTKLQKLLMLVQFIPDTSVQESLFFEIDQFTQFMRGLPASWNIDGLLANHVNQLLSHQLCFPSLPKEFLTTSPSILSSPLQHIFQSFVQFIDADWFTNQIDPNVVEQFSSATIENEPLLGSIRDHLLTHASLQLTLESEGISTTTDQKSHTVVQIPLLFENAMIDNTKAQLALTLGQKYFQHHGSYNILQPEFLTAMEAKSSPFALYCAIPRPNLDHLTSDHLTFRRKQLLAQVHDRHMLLSLSPEAKAATQIVTKVFQHLETRKQIQTSELLSNNLQMRSAANKLSDVEDIFKQETNFLVTQDQHTRTDTEYKEYSFLLRLDAGFFADEGTSDTSSINNLHNNTINNDDDNDGDEGPTSKKALLQSVLENNGEDETPNEKHFVYKQLVISILYQYYLIWKAWFSYQTLFNPIADGLDTDLQILRGTGLFHSVAHSGMLLEHFYLQHLPHTYDLIVTPLPHIEREDPLSPMSRGEEALKHYAHFTFGDYFYKFKPIITSTVLPFNCANGAPLISLAFLDYISIISSGIVFEQPTELLKASTSDQYYDYIGQLFASKQYQYWEYLEINPQHPFITNPITLLSNPFCLSQKEIPQPGKTINFDIKTIPGLLWWVIYYTTSPSYDDIITLISHCRTDILNLFGQSTLMVAVAQGWSFNSLATLARRMININLQDCFGRTVLHYFSLTAAFTYAPELLDFLIFELGAVINIVDVFGHSPLTYALYNHAPTDILKKLITYTLTRTAKQYETYYQYYEPIDSILNRTYDERFLSPRPYLSQPYIKQFSLAGDVENLNQDLTPDSDLMNQRYHPHYDLSTAFANANYVFDAIQLQALPTYPHILKKLQTHQSSTEKQKFYIDKCKNDYFWSKDGEFFEKQFFNILTVTPQQCTGPLLQYISPTVVPDSTELPEVTFPGKTLPNRTAFLSTINGNKILRLSESAAIISTEEPSNSIPITFEGMIEKGYLNFPWHVNYLLHTTYANDFAKPFIIAASDDNSDIIENETGIMATLQDVRNVSVMTTLQHSLWTVEQMISIYFNSFSKTATIQSYLPMERYAGRKPTPLSQDNPAHVDFIADRIALNSGTLLNLFEIMMRCQTQFEVVQYLVQTMTYALLSIHCPLGLHEQISKEQFQTAKHQVSSVLNLFTGTLNSQSIYQHRVSFMETEVSMATDLPIPLHNFKVGQSSQYTPHMAQKSPQEFLASITHAYKNEFCNQGLEAAIVHFCTNNCLDW